MTHTQDYYLQRIDHALAFITTSLSNDYEPNLSEIAAAASLSKYHFHRIYRLVTGETCQQTLTRIKLAIATATLAQQKGNVTMAAMNANYHSSQALAKALKKATGFSPKQLQQDPDRLARTIERFQRPQSQTPGLVSIELTQLSPVQYIAKETNLPYEQFNSVYEQLFIEAGGEEAIEAIVGFSLGDKSNLRAPGATFECGLVLNQFDGLDSKQSDGGNYLCARHVGDYDNLDQTVDQLYHFLLSQSQTQFDDKALFIHYLDDPEHVDIEDLRADIYLAVAELSDELK